MEKNLGISDCEPETTLRIGQAAGLLGVSVDTIRRWEEEGTVSVTRSPGGHRLIPMAEIRRLLAADGPPQHPIERSSARNQLPAIVTAVKANGVVASVEMLAGAFRLVALTTAESAEELALAPGVAVVASVKSTNVVVGLPR